MIGNTFLGCQFTVFLYSCGVVPVSALNSLLKRCTLENPNEDEMQVGDLLVVASSCLATSMRASCR